MGVDKSYGSGKPRSSANSASRRTQAAKANSRKITQQKQAAKPFAKAIAKAVADGSYGKIQEIGVLGSRGFVQAAARLGEAVVRRAQINTVRTAISGKAQNMPGVDVATGNSPFLNSAIQGARRELVATTGPGSTYTGMRSVAANMGREMARDMKKVDYAMKKFGPNSSIARDQALRWHGKRDLATALKQESRKALSTKRTAK